MEVILRSLAQYSAHVLLFLCVLIVLIGIAHFVQVRRQAAFSAQWQQWLKGATGESLEELLLRHLHERRGIESELSHLRDRVSLLERELALSKRHVGLVRYDAFEDVTGNQSFALAVYDDNGDGAILNGVVGRMHSKVYCKPLLNGRSERNLSQEEERAIREARSTGPKSIVSP
ncbi:MAG TPA: DUF4446 family protein [Fimbriimonas sp.]|nr:DUF4446 family protein [Fimbriimonas sp.]